MPTVRVNGVCLYYETHGAGPALVLIAGLNSDHTLFRALIPRLAERYQVIVFDNRGSGGGGHIFFMRQAQEFTDAVLALLDSLDQ